MKGKINHIVNEKSQYLVEGSLVFVRPNDLHSLLWVENTYCKYVNISISNKILSELIKTMDISNFISKKVDIASSSPTILLSGFEQEIIQFRLNYINTNSWNNKEQLRLAFKMLFIEFLMQFLTKDSLVLKSSNIPDWFSRFCIELEKKDNFTKEINEIFFLTDRSKGHVCREMKKHMNKTLSDYINEKRLNYSANLLNNTDYDILYIALESGFQNLSHFYHLFKRRYNLTPMQFRTQYQAIKV
jgi:AraC family cel operon transcriptional repressor